MQGTPPGLNTAGLLAAIQRSRWTTAVEPLEALQEDIRTALEKHCPHAKPCPQVRHEWSPRAAELLAGSQRAQRRFTASSHPQDYETYQYLSNQLARKLLKSRRDSWHRFLAECTTNPKDVLRRNIWRMSSWSKRVASATHCPKYDRTALIRETELRCSATSSRDQTVHRPQQSGS
jgi:hypothetical protein